jgi:hypothetical protein
MNMPADPTIPVSVNARQAVAAIRGYAFQLYVTAEAWLKLEPGALLLVEVADDYATVAKGGLNLTQVKNASSRSTTLRSEGVIKNLNNFWELQIANPKLAVYSTYLTTSRMGHERGVWLPNERPGLAYWQAAAAGEADVGPLRTVLLQLPLNARLHEWIAAVSDEQLRLGLLARVEWLTGYEDLRARAAGLIPVVRRRAGTGATVHEARRALDGILMHLLKAAAGLGSRSLSAQALDEVLEQTITVQLRLDQLRALSGEPQYHPPLDLRERESDGGRLFFFGASNRVPLLEREDELSKLQSWLIAPEVFSWTLLSGPGGAGKSRLALELCLRAIKAGWDAGFLSSTSPYADPEQFLRFDPEKPTLMILDYVADDPARGGTLVRILIERDLAGDIPSPVRVLVLERSGREGPWYSLFTAGYKDLVGDYFTKFDAAELTLKPLSARSLFAILQHVAGDQEAKDDGALLTQLKHLDPQGRPLFAALAGDAIRHGRSLRHLSKAALVQDLLDREQRRWVRFAPNYETLRRHINAAILATLIGGLELREELQHLNPDRFPFSEGEFNKTLMNAISGGRETNFIPSIEPDIVGEWFALEGLKPCNPFDRTGGDLITAAERLSAGNWNAAVQYARFRMQAFDDFPEETLASGLLRSPGNPESAGQAWLWLAANVLPGVANDFPDAARQMSAEVRQLGDHLFYDTHAQILVAHALANYASALSLNDPDASTALFNELVQRATERTCHVSDYGRIVSQLGLELGERRLIANDEEGGDAIFERMREHAARFVDIGDEREEIAEDAASLGLSIRKRRIGRGDRVGLEASDRALWRKSVETSLDLAGRAGQVLMQRSDAHDLGPPAVVYEELKALSLQRNDVPELAFWAANVGYCLARDAQEAGDRRAMVDHVRDVASWIAPRVDWADMPEVVWDMARQGWITEDFELGRVAVAALFDLWEAAFVTARDHRARRKRGEAAVLYTELMHALDVQKRVPWARAMYSEMRTLLRSR